MISSIVIVLFAWIAWRFLYPPLCVILFAFTHMAITPGTAALFPFSQYTQYMVWGCVLGAAFKSGLRLYQTRNAGTGGRFAWRVVMVCVLMIVLVRVSMALKADLWGLGFDACSIGPLALIVTLAYLYDRRALWCFGLMLVLQLGLSLYLTYNPQSRMNGSLSSEDDADYDVTSALDRLEQQGAVGSRGAGQFSNTTILAIHAALGAGAGLALLIASQGWKGRRKTASILAGTGLATAGTFLLGVGSVRGIVIGLAFGVLLHLFSAKGLLRAPLLAAGLLFCLVFVVIPYASIEADENSFLGRFGLLRDVEGTQEYRIDAMRFGLDAVQRNPFLGSGDYWNGLEACNHRMPHIGPLFLAVLYGIPVGLLACLVLVWSVMSDLTRANVKTDNAFPAFRAIRAFSTVCCWTAIACVLTNGYAGPIILYIALGIAMWPKVCQRSSLDGMYRHASC